MYEERQLLRETVSVRLAEIRRHTLQGKVSLAFSVIKSTRLALRNHFGIFLDSP